jgi:hypothetical protein
MDEEIIMQFNLSRRKRYFACDENPFDWWGEQQNIPLMKTHAASCFQALQLN